MGKIHRGGRKKKPASLKRGNSESQEELKERASIEDDLRGDADRVANTPEWLDELGKKYYDFIVSELEISGILSNLDMPLIAQTADSLSRMRACDEVLNREGLLVTHIDRNGLEVEREHPLVGTKHKYLNQFRQLSIELGLSPSSRAALASLKIEHKEEEEDPLLKILSGDLDL